MSRKPTKPNFLNRFRGWLSREERYEKETFVEGIANVDSLFGAIAHGLGTVIAWPFVTAGHLMSRVIHGIRHGVSRTIHGLRTGVRRAIHELKVVLGEIIHDLRHLAGVLGRAPIRLLKWLAKPVIKLGALATAPIRQRFAKRAKAEVLSDVTMTSDRHAHWELLALIAVAVVAVGVLLVVSGHAGPLRQLAHSGGSAVIHFNPTNVANWLVTASPAALSLSGAAALFGALTLWFWLRMTLDAWRRDYPTHLEQTRWRTLTLLLFVPGAIAYFAKVYNRWSLRQFVNYHIGAVLMVSTAVLVATSTYGTLWYFNHQADATVQAPSVSVPNLDLDQQTRSRILNRPQYGAAVQAVNTGRVDPFAPIPGQGVTSSPSPNPSPSASPKP
jgi:hypothetical protein